MGDVLFIRELAADTDLVLAFAADGSPAWALDRDTGLQWWFPGGDRYAVRRAIAEHWDSFATMPITAASTFGPHPAIELARRAESSPPPLPASALGPPWRVRPAWLLLGALALVPLVFGLVTALVGGAPRSTVDPAAAVRSAVQPVGGACVVRGDVAQDVEGRVLVCASTSRAAPADLIWRSTA